MQFVCDLGEVNISYIFSFIFRDLLTFKESHEPKTPMKSLKTPKKSFKLSTVAKLTSSLKRTSVSDKGRSKSTSSELATISEGRLARSKSLKTKKESTKIRMAKALETNLIIDQATAQKFGLPMGYVGKGQLISE